MGTHDITTAIVETIQFYLKELAAKALGESANEISTAAGFFELGMDSKMTMELVTALEEKVGHELYPTLLFEYQNIDELSDYLLENDRQIFENKNSIDLSSTKEEIKEVVTSSIAKKEATKEDVQFYLKELAAKALGESANEISTAAGFFELGMDSKMTMELVTVLEEKVGHELYPTLLFEYQNIDELSDYLLANEKEAFTTEKEFIVENTTVETKEFKTVEPIIAAKVEDEDEIDIWETISEEIIHEEKTASIKNEPIAIIGLSGRYPKSKNIDELWENLKLGKDCITEIPEDYWDLEGFFDEDKSKKGKSYSKWGGFIDDADKFDPLFFGISPKAAENMDPQARIFLEESWKAIEDSGHNPSKLSNASKVGVFAGVFWTDYQLLRLNNSDSYPSGFVSAIPNVTSHYLGLKGPSIGLDTQCSSSLTAIYLACESIRNSDCDVALAGGVNVIVHPSKYSWLSDARFLSDKGRCESFGDGGNGYVPSEGVGVVVLKKLSQAEKDGDRIYGVIKGAAINHGGRSSGLTVPNMKAQASAINEAMKKANVAAEDFSYIEAHGTGTSIGDPIEVSGLGSVLHKNIESKCALGSIKSNIGHPEAAAGIAGVTKVLLQLKHKQIAPSLHSKTLNKNISFEKTIFNVPQELQDWSAGSNKKRIAGVSGFGAGGSNAHLIIEEYRQTSKTYKSNEPALIIVSGKSQERLLEQVKRLNEYLDTNNHTNIYDIAYTLQVGRDAMDHRFATIASSINDLKAQCNSFLQSKKGTYVTGNARNNKSDFVLKGNAGRAYIETAIREKEIESLAQLWIRGVAIDWSLMYGSNKPHKISLPTYPFLRERYWIEGAGEIATGGIQKLHPLVHENVSTLEEQKYRTTFSGNESFFNDHKVNGQKVLPGVAYLEWVREVANRSLGTHVTQLKNINWLQPIIIGDTQKNIEISLFEEDDEYGYEIYSQEGANEVIYGQGNVSITTIESTRIVDVEALKRTFSQEKSGNECYQIFEELGFNYGTSFKGIQQLYFNEEAALSKIKVPTDKKYVLQLGVLDSALQSILGVKLGNNEVALNLPFSIKQLNIYHNLNEACWCYVKSNSISKSQGNLSSYDIDILSSSGEVLLEIQGLTTLPYKKEQPKPTKQTTKEGFARQLFTTSWSSLEGVSSNNYEKSKQLVVLTKGNVQVTEYLKNTLEQEVVLLDGANEIDFYLGIQELVQSQLKQKTPIQLTIVYPNNEYSFYAFVTGLLKTVQTESKKIQGKTLGIEASVFNDVEALANVILEEQKKAGNEVRYVQNNREERELIPIIESTNETVNTKDNGVYIITGGTGGLGKIFAAHISKNKTTQLILTGRSAESRLSQQELAKLNAVYFSCDITDETAVNNLVNEVISTYKKIDGIIHSAGVIRDSFLISKTAEDAKAVLKPKIDGVKLLDQATSHLELDFFVFFSSMAGIVGNYGQADYASANAWLDFYATYRNELKNKGKRKGHCLSIDWPLWKDGGMTMDKDSERHVRQRWGVTSLPTEDGIRSFELLLESGLDQGVVAYGAKNEVEERLVGKVNSVVKATPKQVEKVQEIVVATPKKESPKLPQKNSIEEEVLSLIATTIKLDVSRIEADKAFSDYGLDSVMIVSLSQELNKRYPALDLSPMVLINSESILEFTSFLQEEHGDLFIEKEEEATVIVEKVIEEVQKVVVSTSKKVSKKINIEEEVLLLIATTIKLDVSRIEADKAFSDYGLDSVMIVSLSQELNKRYPTLDLSPMVLINSESISEFTSFLQEEHGDLFFEEEIIQATEKDIVVETTTENITIPQVPSRRKKKKESTISNKVETVHEELIVEESKNGIVTKESRSYEEVTHNTVSVVEEIIKFPLTEGQKGLWFIQNKNPETTAYNIPLVFKISSAITTAQIAQFYAYVLEKHPVFRTRFEMNDTEGELYQYIVNDYENNVTHLQIAKEDKIETIFKQLRNQPLDISKETIKLTVVEREDEKYAVFMMHHIIFDGSSIGVFVADLKMMLNKLASNSSVPAPVVDMSYFENAQDEIAYLDNEKSNEDFKYWQNILSAISENFTLPYDQIPNKLALVGEEGKATFSIKGKDLEHLKEVTKSLQANLSIVILSVFKTLLHKLSGSKNIIIKMPTSGRYDKKYKNTVGYFINTILNTGFVSEEKSFSELVTVLTTEFFNSVGHLKYPYSKLLASAGNTNVEALFSVSFLYQNIFNELKEIKEDELFVILDAYRQNMVNDYSLEVIDLKDELTVELKYKKELFSEETVKRHLNYFQTILKKVTENPALKINEIDILSEAETHQLLTIFNDTKFSYPDTNIVKLFKAQAANNPKAIAIRCYDEEISYQELDQRSTQLAKYLQEKQVTPNTLVGIFMDRSIDAVTSMLAVLKSGGAYVPLDPDYPEARINYILEDAIINGNKTNTVNIVLVQENLKEHFKDLKESNKVHAIAINSDWFLDQNITEEYKEVYAPNNLAYVIYTSGSTGKPKGVLIEHSSFIDLIAYQKHYFEVNENDQFLQFSNFSFDASVEQLFLPLVSGSTLNIISKEDLLTIDVLEEVLLKQEITHLHAVPSFLREIPFIPNTKLKRIISGGDVFDTQIIENWGNKGIRIIDKYGPTETTVSAVQRDLSFPLEEKHIGKPLGNTVCYVVDEYHNLLPVGVAGELCIGGAGLAKGYLNRSELTNEKFIKNPFGAGKIYKTGDLVRWLPSGNIEFLGRIDNQVKVNGFRIEIGEVETAINNFDAVLNNVVVTKDFSGNKQMVAYCKTHDNATLPIQDLKEELSKSIPEYMIPKFIVQIDEIPLTPNGKVNRKLLQETSIEINSEATYVAPTTQVEKQLVAIWEELLHVSPIGLQNNFFELGGHSLLAVKLLSRIKKDCNVSLSIAKVFSNKNLKELASSIASGDQKEVVPIKVLENRNNIPLSFEQSRIWFLAEFGKGDQYNIPKLLRVKGALQVAILEKSLNYVLARHEALRTNFRKDTNGDAFQYISEKASINLVQEDYTHIPKEEATVLIQKTAKEFLDASFDLAKDLLIRAMLIKVAEEEHVFALSIHHIVFDGWSSQVFMRELKEVYNAYLNTTTVQLPELPIQYLEYAVWQSEKTQLEGFEKGISYWKNKLDGYKDLVLPTDFTRPKTPSGNGKYIYKKVNVAAKKVLTAFSQKSGGTLFASLLSSVYVLLHKRSNQDDICIGIPVANREHRDLEGLIGFFVNTIVNRIQFKESDTLQTLFEKVQEELVKGQEYGNVPFHKIVDAVQPERNSSISPIFQVIVNYLKIEEYSLGAAKLTNEDLEFDFAKFDLNIDFIDLADAELLVSIGYNTDIYLDATAKTLLDNLVYVIETFAKNSHKFLDDYTIVSNKHNTVLLEDFNPKKANYSSEVSIQELFSQQAKETPNAIAITFEGEHLTYEELDQRSHQFALYLNANGVKEETLVGVCMDKSIEMMVAVLGILKAGGAYVPIDSNYPKDRIAYIVEDSIINGNTKDSVKLIVLQEDIHLTSLEEESEVALVTIAKNWEENNAILSQTGTLDVSVNGNNLAYVMYTSGSTGKPKGVLITHKSVVRLVINPGYHNFNQSTTILSTGAFSFDATVFEFFGPLLNGGKLVLASKDKLLNNNLLSQTIESNKVNTIWFTSSWLNQIVDAQIEVFKNLSTVITGGERLSHQHIKKLKATYNDLEIKNGYGPTENTTFSISYLITEIHGDIPLGKPISDDQVYILGENNTLQPIGEYGELCLGGNGVARGYLNKPELTAEKFIDNPFGAGKIYRSGDIGRWNQDGLIEFLGRKDQQVKIRGFRIELGEIEEALNKLPFIEDSTVIVKEHVGTKQLVAYCVTKEKESFNTKEIKDTLSKELPEYMIPKFIFEVEDVPLTPNGKKDRKFFETKPLVVLNEAIDEPKTATAKKLAAIWTELLEIDHVGLQDNFFELGGHSLLITKLITRIENAFNITLPISQVFETPVLEKLVEMLENDTDEESTDIKVENEISKSPLSNSQQRLLFLDQIGQGGQYHIPSFLRIQGNLDITALEQSFNYLIKRHESLRTRFQKDSDGEPYQYVQDNITINLNKKDFSPFSNHDKEAKLQQLFETFAHQSFDLSTDLLIRNVLIKIAEEEHILGLCIHHIVFDGWSLSIFIKELSKVYDSITKNIGLSLPIISVQYTDYAIWEQDNMSSDSFRNQVSFWKNHLSGYQDLTISTDFPRPKIPTGAGKRKTKKVNESVKATLSKISQSLGSTLFTTLLSSVYVLLHKYSNQDDICIGIPVANRSNKDVEGLVGFFVNTIVNRIQFEETDTIETLFKKVRQELIQTQEHQNIPFDKIVEVVKPPRETSITPIFQVMVNYLMNYGKNFSLGDTTASFESFEYNKAKFDLSIDFVDIQGAELYVSIGYNTDVYADSTAERLLDSLIYILETLDTNLENKLSTYSVLTPTNKEELLLTFNATAQDYDTKETIHSLFEKQVELTPNNVALVFEKKEITYQELSQQSNQLAHYLIDKFEITPTTLIGVKLERNHHLVIALLAVLKTGAAYVPLDINYPKERITYIEEDSKCSLIIDDVWYENFLKEKDLYKTESLTIAKKSSEIAYVIYTSGSTGKPKGVAITHQNAVALIQWSHQEFSKSDFDIVYAGTSHCFDLSIFEMFYTLSTGKKIRVLKNALEIVSYLKEDRNILLNTVPSSMRTLLNEGIDLSNVKAINLAGEPFPIDITAKLLATNAEIRNLYGPSEDTTYSTTYQLNKEENYSSSVPIGKPISNTQAYVLDKNHQLVPIGVPGRLYLSGDGISKGYLHKPELTSERFIASSFINGATLYDTGDVAKWLPNGTLEYLGRQDNQVKIRGHRIELGEIENVLNNYSTIQESVVIAKEHLNSLQLVAYCVTDQEALFDAQAIKSYVHNYLPEYMIPSFLSVIDSIPLTPNGKVDRKKLLTIDVEVNTSSTYQEASTKTEKEVTKVWKDLLQVESIGVQDNFFELGGHSLLVTQLNQKIKESFGNVSINIIDFINNPTVYQQAKLIDKSQLSASHLIHFNTAKNEHFDDEVTFIIPGMPGIVDGYYELAEEFANEDRTVYGIQMKGVLKGEEPLHSLEDMARHNIKMIQEVAANTVRLVAHSYGGAVVFEMLKQLAKENIKITEVILIDSYAPHKGAKITEIYKGLIISLLTIVKLNISKKEILELAKRAVKQPKQKRKEFVYDFLISQGGTVEKDFFSRLFDLYISAMEVSYKNETQLKTAVTLVIAEATKEKIAHKLGWTDYFTAIEVIPTQQNHFSLVKKPNINSWKNQLENLVL